VNRSVLVVLAWLSVAVFPQSGGRSAVGQGPASRSAPAWSDSFVSRLEALALMQSLSAEILVSTSATTTLEKWCRDHRLAEDPRIVARRVSGVEQQPTREQRERLQVTHGERVRYRRVELVCGNQVLSVAENWYVPDRLTAAMNRELDTTDAPFGRVVRPLGPFRRTFAARMLWRPLREGWELGLPSRTSAPPAEKLDIPEALFEHQAVLYTSRNRPFAEVHEQYQRGILAFPQPR
jgi:chorismate-pyruvate lyase